MGMAGVLAQDDNTTQVDDLVLAAPQNVTAEGTADAQQQEEEPTADAITYPVFNASEVFPDGIFNATAYSDWLSEVSNFTQTFLHNIQTRELKLSKLSDQDTIRCLLLPMEAG